MYLLHDCLSFLSPKIFKFDIDSPVDLDGPYKGRLRWDGTQDLQDLSISIINVTFNDSGVFECNVIREFVFDSFNPSVSITKEIKLTVKAEGAANSFLLFPTFFRPVLCSGLALCLFAISVQLSVRSSWGSVSRHISSAGLFQSCT